MDEFRAEHETNTGYRVLSRIARAVAAAVCFSGIVSAAPQGTPPPCVEVSSEARYRAVGYDHIVRIDNHCDASAICDVWTNVNPEPARVSIPPKEAVEILTFRGSPAREFTAYTQCRLVL